MRIKKTYIPMTPGGTILENMEADTEKEAWSNLLESTSFMGYKSKEILEKRGYEMLSSEEDLG